MPSPPPLVAAQMEKITKTTADPPQAYPMMVPTVFKTPLFERTGVQIRC